MSSDTLTRMGTSIPHNIHPQYCHVLYYCALISIIELRFIVMRLLSIIFIKVIIIIPKSESSLFPIAKLRDLWTGIVSTTT